MASVVPRTKTISRGSGALTKRWTVMRARSYAAVARSLSAYTPRCTLAFSSAKNRDSRSITALGFWVVAALSR
jgi:hypothetical protein